MTPDGELTPDEEVAMLLALQRNGNEDGDMSGGGRTRAEIMEAPQTDAEIEYAIGRDAVYGV